MSITSVVSFLEKRRVFFWNIDVFCGRRKKQGKTWDGRPFIVAEGQKRITMFSRKVSSLNCFFLNHEQYLASAPTPNQLRMLGPFCMEHGHLG